MEKRILGKTGEKLSIVGFGGIALMNETTADCKRIVAQAIDRDINYFDVAPSYGNAEEMLGPALEPYRKNIFLACKTLKRTKNEINTELENSFKLLKTDHFDLYQMHAVEIKDIDQIFAPGGALEAFLQLKKEGKINHIGFSSHSEEAALKMIDRYEFDSILFPFNYVCWYQGNFGERVIDKAKEKGLGILALKIMTKRKWKENEERIYPKCWYIPVESDEEAQMAMNFTFSLPITAGPSPSHEKFLWMMCDGEKKLKNLSENELLKVKKATEGLDPIFKIE